MMYLPAPTTGGDFAPCPVGSHLAVCFRVIDLGTQKTTFQGEAKVAHKIMISWELPDELMNDGRPFTVSKRYTWSMHEKSTLRQQLEAWRGKAFVEADFGPTGFDIRNVIGKACILGVVHQERDGKTYTNVASVGKPMKGLAVPDTTQNPQAYLWLHPERWEPSIFNGLSAGLQEIIRQSPEYLELVRKLDSGHDHHDGGYPEQAGSDLVDDEIPF